MFLLYLINCLLKIGSIKAFKKQTKKPEVRSAFQQSWSMTVAWNEQRNAQWEVHASKHQFSPVSFCKLVCREHQVCHSNGLSVTFYPQFRIIEMHCTESLPWQASQAMACHLFGSEYMGSAVCCNGKSPSFITKACQSH